MPAILHFDPRRAPTGKPLAAEQQNVAVRLYLSGVEQTPPTSTSDTTVVERTRYVVRVTITNSGNIAASGSWYAYDLQWSKPTTGWALSPCEVVNDGVASPASFAGIDISAGCSVTRPARWDVPEQASAVRGGPAVAGYFLVARILGVTSDPLKIDPGSPWNPSLNPDVQPGCGVRRLAIIGV